MVKKQAKYLQRVTIEGLVVKESSKEIVIIVFPIVNFLHDNLCPQSGFPMNKFFFGFPICTAKLNNNSIFLLNN